MTWRKEHGAAAVEMALVMPLLFLLLFGIVVFGIHLFRLQSMEAAVREGGRIAAVRASMTEVQDRVLAEQRIVDPADVADFVWTITLAGTPYSSTTAPCTDASRGDVIRIAARVADPASYALNLPFIGEVAPDFETSAAFRCE